MPQLRPRRVPASPDVPLTHERALSHFSLGYSKVAKIEYKLVTTDKADAEKGVISTTSPIGKALLNRRVGDEVPVLVRWSGRI